MPSTFLLLFLVLCRGLLLLRQHAKLQGLVLAAAVYAEQGSLHILAQCAP